MQIPFQNINLLNLITFVTVMTTKAKKILIIRLGRIGDMVLSRPLLAQLSESSADNSIDVLASRDNHRVISKDEFVNDVIVWDKNPLKAIPILMKLRSRKYDILIEPKDHFSQESQIIASVTNAKESIGFIRDKNSVFDIDVTEFNRDYSHFQDRILSTLRALNIEPNFNINYPLPYDKSTNDNEEKYYLFNVAASSESKSIGIELGSQILNDLINRNVKVKLITAPNNKKVVEELSKRSGYDILTTQSIEATYQYIDSCNGLITADTSLVHIAGTYNTPVLVFSKSIERELIKFAPKSGISLVVKSDSSDSVEISPKKIKTALDEFTKQTLDQ
jgi:ADP-heptose:LPS heptosyltransferase